MFSFLKFLNSKSGADKQDKAPNNGAGGRTMNLNSPEARVFNFFNGKSPVARKPNDADASLRSSYKETVTSPGFSFRIAQRAREMRPTTPSTDVSNVSSSYTLENSQNCSNTVNGINTTKDANDKKRKLMETLDNFGVRKRTRQESTVDAFMNRRRRTISETTTPDCVTAINGYSHRLPQPTSALISSKCIIGDNKKSKRHGDFGTNTCHSQKKPRTRNNEILSSYSSSKFLLKSGQKRPYQPDYDDKSPDRKHCKSCTCCGSTIILENDQNNLNKSDKTTETDLGDELVTVAASRIFNRSGRTQVVKKMCMKSILDDVFDDIEPVPYTSIDKVEEKKKKAQKKVIMVEQKTDKSDVKDGNYFTNSIAPTNSSTSTSKLKELQSVVTVTSPVASSTTSVSSAVTVAPPQPFGICASESTPKVNKLNKSDNPSPLNFGSPIIPVTLPTDSSQKQANLLDGKVTTNQTAESTNNSLGLQTSKSIVQSPNEQNKPPLQPSAKNETNDTPQSDKNKPTFQFGTPVSTPCEPTTNSSILGSPKPSEAKLPVIKTGSQNSSKEIVPSLTFGNPSENSPKPPTFTFGASNTEAKQSTPVLQFGSTKGDNQQSTPVLQFGTPQVEGKELKPTMQFGTPQVNNKKSTPVVQFGAPKDNDKQFAPAMQFGSPKLDNKPSIPALQFGAAKESVNANSAPLFSFGNNTKPTENTIKPETIKFQFGSSKPDDASSTEPKSVAFGSTNLQNQNIFSFGKTDPPKYDAANDKSAPKIQFSALSTPVFGTSNTDQSKPSFGAAPNDQGPKLVFGSQITDNKPATTASSNLFANNATSPVFQFNSSSTKPNDKASETPTNSFPFSSVKAAPTFGAPALDKPAFQFSAQKAEEPKTQFSSPAFGTQSATAAPYKFGSNDKPATFGNAFPSTTQPLQFASNAEKPAEPFKFGGSAPPNNAFQFGANKADSGPVKFGQGSNTFSSAGFNGFGNSAPQQTATFGSVPPPQPSPFGNMTSSAAPTFGSVAAPTFGNAASPQPSTFGSNTGFQFGSTNNAPSSSSTFAFGGNSQVAKPESAFNFNAAPPPAASPFQFGQAPTAMSTPQFGGTQPQGFGFGSPPMAANAMPGSSQPLFSMGTAPAVERRKAKAVRRRP